MAEHRPAREGWIYLSLAVIFVAAPTVLFYREPIIYRHPAELEARDTRLAHAEVLAAGGKLAEARRMLAAAEDKLRGHEEAGSGDILRRLGELYATLGEERGADDLLSAAVAADQRALELAAGADERARLLLSLARTRVAQGLPIEGASMAATAQRTAASASARYEIEQWLSQLQEHRAPMRTDVERLASPSRAGDS